MAQWRLSVNVMAMGSIPIGEYFKFKILDLNISSDNKAKCSMENRHLTRNA